MSQPRLLVFTLGAHGECNRRRLLPSHLGDWEFAFHRMALETVLDEASACGFELAVASPNRLPIQRSVLHLGQQGSTFGERLAAAADAMFEAPGPVLIVGTDSPELDRGHLRLAAAELGDDPDRVVVGPSSDGGFYLLASRRPIEGLAGIRWCRSDTCAALLKLLADSGRPVVLLPELADIDGSHDFEAWLSRGSKSRRPALGWSRFTFELRQRLCRSKVTVRPFGLDPLDRPPATNDPSRAPPLAA